MQRVMIVGGCGAGKSTLARELGRRTGLPVFHTDQIHWRPGWVERPQAEKRPLLNAIVARDAWIIDGNQTVTLDQRLSRADTFVWLDLPVARRLARVIRRTVINRGQTRPDLPENCPERLNREFLEFLAYIWRTRHTSRTAPMATVANPPPHLTAHRLASTADVAAFLATA